MRTYPTRPALYRIARIDVALRSGRNPDAGDLAEAIEVSRRTIYRDIEYMRDMLGAPIVYDTESGGYRYTDAGFRLPAVTLGEGELLSILVAAQVVRAYAGTRFETPLRAAFKKLAVLLPDEVSASISELASATSFTLSAPRISDVERVQILLTAVRENTRLRIRYHSLSSDTTRVREVDPYRLLSIDGSWYLVAHCHLRNDTRIFVPERMEEIEETSHIFEPPPALDLDAYMASAFRVMRGGTPRTIRLRFQGVSAAFVAERRWHSTQKIRNTETGCELELTLGNLEEVARWVMSFGSECEAIEPAELRRLVAGEMTRGASRYNG